MTATSPDIDSMIERILAGDSSALDATDHDQATVDALLERAARPEIGARFIALPRPDAARGDHPGLLMLVLVAQVFQFSTTGPAHYSADFLEVLDASLGRGASAWSSVAASDWVLAVLHRGETALGWAMASTLLDRHPTDRMPATVLSAFATLAERAGALEQAAILWMQARTHADVVRSARTRWIVDYDWARGHLLLSRGALGRAAAVLDQVQSGLVSMDDPQAHMYYLNAGIELTFAHSLAGRPAEALESARHSAAHVLESETEYRAWLQAIEALPHALSGDAVAALDAARALADATTDTCSVELAATIPAEAIACGLRADLAGLHDAMERARRWEMDREIDPEMRLLWRTFAVWGCILGGDTAAGTELCGELGALADEFSEQLPGYVAHAQLAVAAVANDRERIAAYRDDLVSRGVVCAPDAIDPWGLVQAPTSAPPVRTLAEPTVCIEVLDGVRVLIDGSPLDTTVWEGRRKARVALALLVAAGGAMQRDELVDALWTGEALDPATQQARLSTVLAAIRRTIGAEARATDAPYRRSLVLSSTYVELRLASHDTTDLGQLQALVRRIASCDSGALDEARECVDALLPLVQGVPLREVEAGLMVASQRATLEQVLGGACVSAIGAWLAAARASAQDKVHVGEPLLDVAAHAVRLRPYDEIAVMHRIDVLVLAGRRTEASLEFHAARERLRVDFGTNPTVELVRHHAAILGDGTDRSAVPAST